MIKKWVGVIMAKAFREIKYIPKSKTNKYSNNGDTLAVIWQDRGIV